MKSTYKWGAVAFGISLVSTIVYGQARTPYTRPAYITTPGTVTAGSVVSNGNVSVPDTYSICYDGPACTTSMKASGNSFEWRKQGALVMDVNSLNVNYWYRQNVFAGNIQSNGASGTNAYTCANVGCRLSLGNTARYLVDDGSRLSSPSAIASSDFTKDDFNNLLLTGRREDSASSIGIIMRNSFALTTAGSKLVSFRNPTTTEIASIDKDGAYTGLSCNATATSGSSFTGGNSSNVMTLTSNATDAVTSSTVPAIRLQASQNITDTDLLMSVEDSAGNRRMSLTEAGSLSIGNLTSIDNAGFFLQNAASITIPDNGAGTPAAYTWQPSYTRALTLFTCNDANGCDITLSETTIGTGVNHRAVNVSANNLTFTDTAGVTEMAGNFTAGQWDTISFIYITDRFVEVGRVDN